MSPAEQGVVRILFVEDNSDDVELELAALRARKLPIEHRVVETRPDLRQALENEAWDLIICDYWMPELRGLDALSIAKEVAPLVPFILVSGTIGEDVAVEAMRAGAHDYVLKDNLARLASAVERELRESENRKSGYVSRMGLRLLADVGTVLARSLDLGQVLDDVARVVTGELAALCIIDVADDEGGQARRAMVVADPAKAPLLRRLADAQPGSFAAIAEGLGCTAVLSRPLLADGSKIGAIHLAGRRAYSATEAQIVDELSARLAVSIENARLYERARQAVQLRDEFLSIAAHELRTPITALQLQLQSLQDLMRKGVGPDGDGRFQVRLARSTHTLDRLALLVESLLDVSRISTGRMKLNVEPFDLAAMAWDVRERLRDEAVRAGSELRVVAPRPVLGAWDRLRIEQVLTNLLTNAMKYGAGHPVEITVAEEEGRVVLSVVDRGIGISPKDLERIFERFERAVPSRHYGGLGLGLFIARRIVEAHGGRVSARSEPGRGATFTVELPMDATPARESPGAGAARLVIA